MVEFHFEHPGYCCICEEDVVFESQNEWFRDHLFCKVCGSIPRERALIHVIEDLYPEWRHLSIHESSPVARGASAKLATAPGYVASQYDPSVPWGKNSDSGYVSQDLEAQTFGDCSFDLVVSQDVCEHIFDLDSALREIARTLKPGGSHIFTTPLVNKTRPTEAWARREEDGSITFLAEPEYHGNPMDSKGSLVTWHFGFDLALRILTIADMPTVIIDIDRLDLGIQAEYCEVMVATKTATTG